MKSYANNFRTLVVLTASLLLLVSAAPSARSTAPSTKQIVGQQSPQRFKSYREWKLVMASEAEVRFNHTRDLMLTSQRVTASKDPNNAPSMTSEAGLHADLQAMQRKYEKERLQLSMAHDLTISDYFVGYLTKQADLGQAIKEVSDRLSAEEVAELMNAYANNFFISKPTSTKQGPQADLTGARSQ